MDAEDWHPSRFRFGGAHRRRSVLQLLWIGIGDYTRSVKEIGDGAFTQCFGLASITSPGSVETLGANLSEVKVVGEYRLQSG